MTRRNRKRVDYSNFGAGSAEDSDDDFQESLSPPVAKKTKKIKEKKNSIRKEVTLKEDHGNKRKTRTSNAELIFEEDINMALQLSSTERRLNYESDDDIVEQKRKKAKKTVIEVISDEDEEEHGNNEDKENLQTTKMQTYPRLTDTDLTSLTTGANHPKEKGSFRKDMSLKASFLTEINCTSVRSIPERSKGERDSKLIVASPEVLPQLIKKRFKSNTKDARPSTPKVAPSCQSVRSPCFQSTPGRLRLGLSRNIRIAKPLHPHIVPNVIVAQK